ncbi:MAG: FHA domain-containing protein, partial [Chloroflexota bacterium]
SKLKTKQSETSTILLPSNPHAIYVIGRDNNSDIVIPHPAISNLHVEICYDYYFFINDKSRNGTFVNGERIIGGREQRLLDRDQIAFANEAAIFEFRTPKQDSRITTIAVKTDRMSILHYDNEHDLFYLHEQLIELAPQQKRFLKTLYDIYWHKAAPCDYVTLQSKIWPPRGELEHLDNRKQDLSRIKAETQKVISAVDDRQNPAIEIRNIRGTGYALLIEDQIEPPD